MSETAGGEKGEEYLPPVGREKFRISKNLTVEFFPIDYKKGLNPDIIRNFQGAIRETDGAILEYIPSEIAEILGNPLSVMGANPHQIMRFFPDIQDTCFKENKDVYSVDPARDPNFGIIRSATIIPGLAGVSALLKYAHNAKKKRRDFLMFAGFIATAATFSQGVGKIIEGKTKNPSSYYVEAFFRRVVIAEGLKQLGEKFDQEADKPKSLLLVYPLVHWNGVKERMVDPGNRGVFEKFREGFKKMGDDQLDKSFFTIRRFRPTGNGQFTKAQLPMK